MSTPFAARKPSDAPHAPRSSATAAGSREPSRDRTRVWVSGYVRADGTYVDGYFYYRFASAAAA